MIVCSSVGWRSIAGDVHKNANVFMFNHHHHSRTHKYTPEYFGMANGIAGWDSEKTDGMGSYFLFVFCPTLSWPRLLMKFPFFIGRIYLVG